jgi:hypothetical protein
VGEPNRQGRTRMTMIGVVVLLISADPAERHRGQGVDDDGSGGVVWLLAAVPEALAEVARLVRTLAKS